ncbi:hypothetical protein HNQ77_001049 [Silvibacterium bohemicum]|uniref:Uncharacterized protein n=1 Tax=Silvibacterium bohemicum TaxID=1577686 RepID=A0A841JRS6_9BACT|nr:hypothetical protein [Silvibacterium bohemicum]MBB6143105.1 hypothetical protein [Silvibacterium bohemicum]
MLLRLPVSDDRAKGHSYTIASGPDCASSRLACGYRMGKRGSLSRSGVLDADGFNTPAEKSVPFFHLIQGGVQVCDNRFSLVGDDNQFERDLFVKHPITSPSILCLRDLTGTNPTKLKHSLAK